MSKKESLTYEVKISEESEYQIKVRIGDANDGDHNVFGDCPRNTMPNDDDPEWKSMLGPGSNIKNTKLYISSATKKTNPNTGYVSVRVFLNGNQLLPKTGKNELTAEDQEVVFFNQEIVFL
jgi:hypothetical protein